MNEIKDVIDEFLFEDEDFDETESFIKSKGIILGNSPSVLGYKPRIFSIKPIIGTFMKRIFFSNYN